MFGLIEMLQIAARPDDEYCILGRTLRFRRAVGLPTPFVVLAEEDEEVVLLRCTPPSALVCCVASHDLESLSEGADPRELSSEVNESFAEFFAQLLRREEELRARDL